MATTADYLTQLQADKQTLVDNLVAKGVEASNDETFTTLAPKVADISSGVTVTKGVRMDAYDEDGFVTEVSILGLTELPSGYFQGKTAGNSYSTFSQNVQKINILSNITKIDTSALGYHRKMTEINIPDTVTEMGNYALNYAEALKSLVLPQSLQILGEWTFQYLGVTELVIPSGVTVIPTSCIRNCSNLKKVVLEGDITNIGNMAFYYDMKLQTFIMPNITTIPVLGSSVFQASSLSSDGIYVPDNLLEDFKTATNWSTYADQIKPISELEE